MSDMAFQSQARKGNSANEADRPGLTLIRAWLFAVMVLVLIIVMVGGATRLTDSGLSITEWKPITGVVPPLSEVGWLAEFEKYRQIPEYQQINKGMSLDAFKFIYWWEWAHRFLGRVIGVAFFVPYTIFWAKGWLTTRLKWQGAGLLALGGLQGFVGWYMVSSGLTERVDVSQYRLALHLGLAAIIVAALAWVAQDVDRQRQQRAGPRPTLAVRLGALALAVLVLVQILLGALVAGLDAGLTYVTWPLMDGQIVPDGLFFDAPWYRNLFENILTVQFNHRLVAYGLVVLASAHAVHAAIRADRATARRATLVAAALLVQAAIGIATLLSLVRIDVALTHQLAAFVILILAVLHADIAWRGAGAERQALPAR